MKTLRKIAGVTVAVLWYLLLGALGAMIVFAGVLWCLGAWPDDRPMNAADAMAAAAATGIAFLCAPIGLFLGLGCAHALFKRWTRP